MRFRKIDNNATIGENHSADIIGATVILPLEVTPDEFHEEHEAHTDSGTGAQAMGTVSYNHHCNEKGNTMATIVKKSELAFTEGYLSHEGTLIAPGFVSAYIELEEFLQHAAFKAAYEAVELPRFEKATNFASRLIEVPEPKTPANDEEARKADLRGAENRLIIAKHEAEKLLDSCNSVVEFVCFDNVVIYDEDYRTVLIDTPTLGNPLKLTKEKLLKLVCEAVGYPLDED